MIQNISKFAWDRSYQPAFYFYRKSSSQFYERITENANFSYFENHTNGFESSSNKISNHDPSSSSCSPPTNDKSKPYRNQLISSLKNVFE
jgi:hypothetical protein